MGLRERLLALLSEDEEAPAETPAETAPEAAQNSQADIDARVNAAVAQALREQSDRSESGADSAETRSDPSESGQKAAETSAQNSQADIDARVNAAVERALRELPKPVVVPQPGHNSASGDPDVSAMTQQEKAKYAAKLDEKNRGQRISM